MHRRIVLLAIGSAVAGTAGCLASPPTGGTPTDTPGDGGPDDGDPFADEPCPSFAESADRTVCAHTLDPETADVYLTVSEQVFAPTTGDDSVETLRFVLHNDSETRFGMNPYAWGIERRTEDGWSHVAPDAHIEPWTYVEPGETRDWLLSVEPHPTPAGDRTVTIAEDLSSGTYAFNVSGALDEDEGRTSVECVALFEVRRS
jgi:hypothetical protein